MKTEIKKVRAAVGMMSLIGVGDTRPARWGNYFSLYDPAVRVANMWAENLVTLVQNGTLEDGMVEVKIYNDAYALVVDERIHSDWLYNKLCFTGSRAPSLEILRDMYSIVGDPNNEIEQYEDPKKYWEDRGATYSNGIISYTVNAHSKEIKGSWND